MRVSTLKSTGELLEAQSGGDPENADDLNVMIQNCVNAGYAETDVSVVYMTDAEYKALYDALPQNENPQPSLGDKVQSLMDAVAQMQGAPESIKAMATKETIVP